MLRKLLYQLKHGTEHLNFGREIIQTWSVNCLSQAKSRPVRILDIGSGQGTDLLNIKHAISSLTPELFGIECYEPNIQKAKQNGITVFSINIEEEQIPAPDEFFDLIIANQIIEHTKEIFWVFSEISRVIKRGGIVIVGVPNLASLHNRIALLLGEQPTAIESLGPHVRGFTKPAMTRLVTCEDFFEVLEVKGSNFYPFPAAVSQILSRLLPTLSVSLFFLLRRTEKKGKFIEILESRFYETPYFRGNINQKGL